MKKINGMKRHIGHIMVEDKKGADSLVTVLRLYFEHHPDRPTGDIIQPWHDFSPWVEQMADAALARILDRAS